MSSGLKMDLARSRNQTVCLPSILRVRQINLSQTKRIQWHTVYLLMAKKIVV
jgi:hypothetical protein